MWEIFEAKKDTRLPIFTERILAKLGLEEKWNRQPAPLWIQFNIKLWLHMSVYFQFLFAFVHSVVSLVVPRLDEAILTPLLMKFFKRGGMVTRFQPPTNVAVAHFWIFLGHLWPFCPRIEGLLKSFINSGVKIASSNLGTTRLTTLYIIFFWVILRNLDQELTWAIIAAQNHKSRSPTDIYLDVHF